MDTRSRSISKDVKSTVYPLSGSKWEKYYALSLGIDFVNASFEEVLSMPPPTSFLRQDQVDLLCNVKLASASELNDAISECTYDEATMYVLKNIRSSLYLAEELESTIDDLAKSMLNAIGFNLNPELSILGPYRLSLFITNPETKASPDIIVMDGRSRVILVVQEDKGSRNTIGDRPEAQLAAEMIAAAKANYVITRAETQTIYGIIARGTQYTFYSSVISKDAISSIVNGFTSDSLLVQVKRYELGPYDQANFITTSADNMRRTLQCLEALRIAISRKS